jgi:hypothetical protein
VPPASKQTQAKGSSRAAAEEPKKDETETPTETPDKPSAVSDAPEGTSAVDAGYAHPDGPDVETGPRTDAATKRAPSPASPLAAPTSDKRPPVTVQRHLSTSPVAAAAGQRSLPGSGVLGLVDEEGSDLDPEEVFDFGDGTTTYATTKVRVYQKFVQQGSRTPMTQLLFPANARVPRDKADLFVHAATAEAQSPLTEAAGRERMGAGGNAAPVLAADGSGANDGAGDSGADDGADGKD